MEDRLTAEQRRLRRFKLFLLLTLLAYASVGVLIVGAAYAQSQSSIIPAPSDTGLGTPPTGSDDKSVEAYYDYLDLQHYGTLVQTYPIQWIPLIEFYFVGGVLVVTLYSFVYAWFARQTGQDLYPVEVYNGHVTERGGPVDPFNWAVYLVIVIYAVFYIIMAIRFGQLY